MKKAAVGKWFVFGALTAIFLFQGSQVLAGSSSRSSTMYQSSSNSLTNNYSSISSSWGSSGTSRDGSTSWSSWSYSDNGSTTSETFCRKCHGDLKRFPILKYENSDKHHLLLNKNIPSNSIAPNDTPGGIYECLNCHSVELANGSFAMTVTRDCLKCHPINTVTGPPHRSSNVHHSSRTFSCNICHSVIGF